MYFRYHILVFSSLLLLANVSHKVVIDRLEPDKTRQKSYCKKLLNNLGRKKEITLSRNFETKMKVSSLNVGAHRLRFIWRHGVQKGSKGTHLENPINFRALLTGKSAFKVLFHHAITPRIDIFDFISDKKNKWGKVKIKPWDGANWDDTNFC